MNVSKATNDEGENVSITLMERGSQWPDPGDVFSSATFENIVMAQGAAETSEAFAGRATRRLADVQAAGQHLKSATLVVSGASGESSPVIHSRLAMILGGLLQKDGKLTLVGDAHLSTEQRADIASVAAALSEYFGPEGPGVRLSLEPHHDAAFRSAAN